MQPRLKEDAAEDTAAPSRFGWRLGSAARPARSPRERHRRTESLLKWAPGILILLGLAAWEIGVRAGAISALFYPPPSAIARTLARLVANGTLGASLAASLARIVQGFALGGGIGLFLGVCMGWSRPLRLVLDPLIAAAHPVPRLAMLPLILLLFGLGETARIVVISISAFFPLLINAAAGVRQLESVYFEVARNFGAGPREVFTWVVLPGSVPSVLSGARLSFVAALRTTLGIELITSDQGLGHLMWFAWETFRSEELYATLVVIAVLGFGTNMALERVTHWLMPWRKDRER